MGLFYDDNSVLYISVHQDGLWPRTGRALNMGEGDGLGFTINIPLPGGSGAVEGAHKAAVHARGRGGCTLTLARALRRRS